MIVFPSDIESSLTEHEGHTLARLAQDKFVLELGAWLGRSTVCMAQTARRLFSVDWHHGDEHAGTGSTLTPYFQNLARYGLRDNVVSIVGRFADVLPALRNESFGMVFLDGFHTYESVRTDIAALTRLVEHGGTVALHDYGVEASSHGGGEFGVTQAAQELLGQPARVVDTLAIFQGA